MSCKAPTTDWLTGKVTNALWCSRQATRQAKWMWAGLQWSHRWWKTAPPLLSEWRSLWGAVGSMKPNMPLTRGAMAFSQQALPYFSVCASKNGSDSLMTSSNNHKFFPIIIFPRKLHSVLALLKASPPFKTSSSFHICSQIVPFSSVSIHPVSAQHIR